MSYYDQKSTEKLYFRMFEDLSSELDERFNKIEDYLKRESGYNSDGEWKDEITILQLMDELAMMTITECKDHIENTKCDIIRELKDHVDSRLHSIEESIAEIDNMIRYGPMSQVAIDAKSDFESRVTDR